MIPIVSIVGCSGAGKTTLISHLIPLLKLEGLRVATIKHDAHRFDIDHPGKDSYIHKHSGADAVALVADDKFALIHDTPKVKPIEEIAQLFDDVDIILTEGYRTGTLPKIEVYRPPISDRILTKPEDGLLAIVSDSEHNVALPTFSPQDHHLIAQLVLEICLPSATFIQAK